VLGIAIDAGLPFVYGGVFVGLMLLQYAVRHWVNATYAENQRATNSMTARTYTAWDNITSGNRYNFRTWHAGFKKRLRDALYAQIRAIMAKQGIAAASGIASLLVIMAYLAYVAGHNANNTALLIALAATLPRQIELSYNVHDLAAGWSDIQALWTRMHGASTAMQVQADEDFQDRIHMANLRLEYLPPSQSSAAAATHLSCPTFEAACAVLGQLHSGVVQVRGSNGAGKSTLLAALKHHIGPSAYYWPTSTKLAFEFAAAETAALEERDEDVDGPQDDADESNDTAAASQGFSSGERQLQSLTEIVRQTHAKVYLLDEWDANLDAGNRATAQKLIDELASRSLVVEISHRG
jgi:ABC-type multidrug transport system fused ATPase/permease subunit